LTAFTSILRAFSSQKDAFPRYYTYSNYK